MTEDFRGLRDLLAAARAGELWNVGSSVHYGNGDPGLLFEMAEPCLTSQVRECPSCEAADAIVTLLNSLPGLLERIDKLETLLREVEWFSEFCPDWDGPDYVCVSCQGSRDNGGHERDCKLAALLAPAEPPDPK